MLRCKFDRIGRNRAVPPLTIAAKDPDEIAKAIYRYARRYVMSRDVEVTVNGDGDTPTGGTIFCGCQVGGSFTLEEW